MAGNRIHFPEKNNIEKCPVIERKSKFFCTSEWAKQAPSFLQYKVFPRFRGICYVQRTRYRKWHRIIPKLDCERILASNEFDRQMKRECEKLARNFPGAVPILVLRRHGSYIASQYRRFVKNGYRQPFQAFFDLKSDRGYFSIADLSYGKQLSMIEKIFGRPPLLFIYEDMKARPEAFVQELAGAIGAEVDMDKIDFKPRHRSYSEKQLKAVMAAGKYINLKKRRVFKNPLLHLLWRLYMGALRYGILYAARLLPASLFSGEPLIDPAELKRIDAYFEKDWHYCLALKERQRAG